MSPFSSKAQQHYLYAKKPKMAKEFSKHMDKSDYKKLPNKKLARDMARKK